MFQSYGHHHQQQLPAHQPTAQPQYIHQGAAPASTGGGLPTGVNPYARGSAYSAHYPRPHGQFPPTRWHLLELWLWIERTLSCQWSYYYCSVVQGCTKVIGHDTFTHSIIKCWQMFKILLWRVINNTHLMASFPDNPDKVAEEDRAIMDLNETKRWDGIGISWTTCKLFAPWSGQMTMPAPFQSVFQAKCSSWCPAKSVRTLCFFLENLVHMCELQLRSGRFLTDRFLWASHSPGSKLHILELWILWKT